MAPFLVYSEIEEIKASIQDKCHQFLKDIELKYRDSFFQGKMIRSIILFLLNDDLNINHNDLLKLSASIELMHEASLTHDDIEDKQEIRRSSYTTWVTHGMNQAINIGDYLLITGIEPLMELKSLDSLESVKTYNQIVKEVLLGQILEQESLGKIIPESKYFEICELKTGTLLKAPLHFLRNELGMKNYENLLKAFNHLAIAYQLENDRKDFLQGEEGNDFINNLPTLPYLLIYKDTKLTCINNKNTALLFRHKDINEINEQIKILIKNELSSFYKYSNNYSKKFTNNMDFLFSKYFKRD